MKGTGINTQQSQSRFHWESNKFSLTIQHPPPNLPDISINESFAPSTIFRALVSRVVNIKNNPIYGCCFTHMDSDDDNEDHCIDKLGEHSKCYHGKSAFTTSHNDSVSEFFEIGETLFLTNDGWSGIVKVEYFFLDKAIESSPESLSLRSQITI